MEMNAMLSIRIHDERDEAIKFLPEHILRAQRYAWFCDGYIEHSEAPSKRRPSKTGRRSSRDPFIGNISEFLEIENLGRLNAHEREQQAFDSIGFDGESQADSKTLSLCGVSDSTIEVSELSAGSLLIVIGIPVIGFVALGLAALLAKQQNQLEEFRAKARTLTAIEKELTSSRITKQERAMLLSQLIETIGPFDSSLVIGLTLKIGGHEITIGLDDNTKHRQIPAKQVPQ